MGDTLLGKSLSGVSLMVLMLVLLGCLTLLKSGKMVVLSQIRSLVCLLLVLVSLLASQSILGAIAGGVTFDYVVQSSRRVRLCSWAFADCSAS